MKTNTTQILSRQAHRIRIQGIQRTTGKQDQSHLGQSDKTARKLRSRQSHIQPQPTTQIFRRERESDVVSKFDMRRNCVERG